MLDTKFFITESQKVKNKYREHIFDDAKDVFDKQFKPYTSKVYEERKRAGDFKRFEKREKLTAPVLTGDLYRDLAVIGNPTATGFQMGWSVWGAKVVALDKLGRVLTSPKQAIPKSVAKYLQVQGDKYIDKKLGPNKTTRHKIGKK